MSLDGNQTIATLTNGEGAQITLQAEHGKAVICIMQVFSPDGTNFIGLKLNSENRYRLRRMLELMDA